MKLDNVLIATGAVDDQPAHPASFWRAETTGACTSEQVTIHYMLGCYMI